MRRAMFFLLTGLSLLIGCSSPKPAPATRPKPLTPAARPPSAPAGASGNLPLKAGNRTVNWIDSERLMPVLEEAQRVNKPVFVDFDAAWCAPCKVMDEEVLSHPDVFGFLNSHFLCIRIDYDSASGKNICTLYNVQGLPTVLFLNPKGAELARETGISTVTRLKGIAEAALGKM